ncbi:MAG TPA: hypothetical protein PK231_03910, partial [Acidocella sp.]|nr:hypothetical protein [Acidocella sp.]
MEFVRYAAGPKGQSHLRIVLRTGASILPFIVVGALAPFSSAQAACTAITTAPSNIGGACDAVGSGVFISSGATALTATSNLGTLSNSGTINVTGNPAINNNFVIGTLLNNPSGSIIGGTAISGTGTISNLTNSGSIVGVNNDGVSQGAIGTLSNLAGLIYGNN